jgi:hypothetical protein
MPRKYDILRRGGEQPVRYKFLMLRFIRLSFTPPRGFPKGNCSQLVDRQTAPQSKPSDPGRSLL